MLRKYDQRQRNRCHGQPQRKDVLPIVPGKCLAEEVDAEHGNHNADQFGLEIINVVDAEPSGTGMRRLMKS